MFGCCRLVIRLCIYFFGLWPISINAFVWKWMAAIVGPRDSVRLPRLNTESVAFLKAKYKYGLEVIPHLCSPSTQIHLSK